MGNLGSGELLVIFFVALIVLGPNKLPDAARQVGRAVNEIRRISGGFQREMREAMNEPIRAAEEAKAQIMDPFTQALVGRIPVRLPPEPTPIRRCRSRRPRRRGLTRRPADASPTPAADDDPPSEPSDD